jgi:hypothetical protein
MYIGINIYFHMFVLFYVYSSIYARICLYVYITNNSAR